MAKHQRDNARDLKSQAASASALIEGRKASRPSAGQKTPTPAPRQEHPKSLGQFIMRNLLYILSAIAVIAVVTLIVIIVAPFAAEDANEGADPEDSYVSPYDWTCLDRSDGRYAYVVDGEVKSRLGIDVSENQHQIDWSEVATDGIDFAMVRLGYRGATEGALYLDERYEDNFAGARNAGIDCGVYFFSQAISVDEAIEEAEFVLDNLNGAQLEYPIAYDCEKQVTGVSDPRISDLSRDEATEIAEAFCNRIEQAGYRAFVYGNAVDLSRYNRSNLEARHIWWAEYDVPVPTAKIDIEAWQYSNNGKVAGISEPVDMNIDLTGVLD